jgi:hypothetical protein
MKYISQTELLIQFVGSKILTAVVVKSSVLDYNVM